MAKAHVYLIALLFLFYHVIGQQVPPTRFSIVQVGANITVIEGNSAAVNDTHIRVIAKDFLLCRVEVILDPICLRFGNISSKGFSCDFHEDSIFYDHFGSPISAEDCIKLKFFVFYSDRTVNEMIKIKIKIGKRNTEERLSKPEINIKEIGGVASIGNDILPSLVRPFHNDCTILFKQSTLWPASGKLIFLKKNISIYRRCSSFSAIYKHDSSYIPNVDYVPFEIRVRRANVSGEVLVLKYHLQVNILPAQNKESPFVYSRFSRIVVRQYALKQIRASNIRAVDFKTSQTNLLLTVSTPIRRDLGGYFASTEKPDLPLEGFTQEQVNKQMIIFVSPTVINKRLRSSIQQMYIQATDSYGASSKRKMRLLFFIRKFIAYYLSVVQNKPIHVLEGQSNNISSWHIDIACKNSKCERAKFSVWSGPQYGRLLQNSKAVNVFTRNDILNGKLMYQHDGSETLVDSVVLTVSDSYQVAYATLSIIIEPLDDSPPFLSVNKPIVTSNGKLTKIQTSALKAADPDTKKERIEFHLKKKPKKGRIVRSNSDASFEAVDRFYETELEEGLIYYEKYFDKPGNDMFTIILSDGGSDPNLSREYTARVKILAVDKSPPYKTTDSECLVMINETDRTVSLSFLSYADNTSPSSEIVFTVIPQQNTTSEQTIKPEAVFRFNQNRKVPVKNFTQQQIFHNKIFFTNSLNELGLYNKTIFLYFIVADRENHQTTLQKCRIIILPVDNTPPKIILQEPLRVREGEKICVDAKNIVVTDIDTYPTALKLRLGTLPQHGTFFLNSKQLEIETWISYTRMKNDSLCYFHGDGENLQDSFVIIASDGKRSSKKKIIIEVIPINDERPVFLRDSVRVSVMEASSIVLDPKLFEVVDKDSSLSNLSFYIVQRPFSGFVTLQEEFAKNFTQIDIENGQLVYSQSVIEIGPYAKNDSFKVGVCDLYPVTDECSSVLSVLVDVIPINSSPTKLTIKEPLHVNEGGRVLLDNRNLICMDNDTVPNEIEIQILTFPRFGFLENIAPSEGSEQSNAGVHISAFKCSDLNSQTVYYVQNNHTGIEPTNDSISVKAFDRKFQSNIVELKIDITPISDEPPKIEHDVIKVHEGGWKLINSKFLRITDGDIPKENLYFYLESLPKHGQIFYRCASVNPGLKRLGVGQMLSYDRCTLVYGHDDSESHSDELRLAVTDRRKTVKFKVYFEIISVNDQKPTVIKNVTMTVRFGGTKNVSSGYLATRDLDTPDDAILYKITTLPRYGILQKNDVTAEKGYITLTVDSTFSQADINENTIRYENHLMPANSFMDGFKFSLTDGVHSSHELAFLIRIKLSCRKYLNVITNDVEATKPKSTVTESNLRVETRANGGVRRINTISYQIIRPPSHGILVLSGTPMKSKTFSFSQNDLSQNRLEYKPRNYPLQSNDTFKFIVTDGKCLQRGRLNILASKAIEKIKLLNRHSPLNVIKKGLTTITPLELRASEAYDPKDVIYKIVEAPKHGVILKNGKNSSQFTQADINELSLGYKLINEKASQDHLRVQMFLRNKLGQVDSTVHENFTFNAKINIPIKFRSRVITNEKITALEYLYPNVLGTTITKRQLLTYNCSFMQDPNLVYVVIEPPIHGELFHKYTGLPVARFTQDDINKGKIIYKLTDKQLVSFDDKVFLDVVSDGCEKLKEIEFGINWSIITLSDDISIRCSSGRTSIGIKLLRKGYNKQGSVVEVHMKSVGDEKKSFAPSRVWFYPNVAEKRWTLPNNVFEYELIHVRLKNEFNSLLGKKKSIVVDVSKAADQCSKHISTTSTEGASKKLPTGYNFSITAKPGGNSFHAIRLIRPSTENLKRQKKQLSEHKKVLPQKRKKLCEEGWKDHKTNCYKLFKRPSSWRRAVKICRTNNASLFTPTSKEEATFVNENQDGFVVWLGIKKNKRRRWKWNVKNKTEIISRKLDLTIKSSTNKNKCISANGDGEWKIIDCKKKTIKFVCRKPMHS